MRTERYLSKSILKQNYKNQSEKFYTYDNIKLKLYLEIAKSGNVLLLSLDQKHCVLDECYEAWEQIVKRSSEVTGNYDYMNYQISAQTYGLLIAEYNLVKACLLKLLFKTDDRTIEILAERGYTISVDGGKKAHHESLFGMLRRSDNIATKIKMQYNQLLNNQKDAEGQKRLGFEELLANLNAQLQFKETSDITLAAYNEYHRILKKKKPKQSL